MESRKHMGKLLVDAGIISVKTLERTLDIQKGSGKRIGELLRDMGIVTEEEVTEALASQCNLRTVRNIANHSFPKELLDMVPARMALEMTFFPLKCSGDTLVIATPDPFDSETFIKLAKKTAMRIYLVLATRKDILEAIEKHYKIEEKAPAQKQKILLIDDSPVFVKVLNTALTNEGYEVLLAGDGIEGLKLVHSHHPDLILCDLFLPHMDGYSFIINLKSNHKIAETPVILVTSKASTDEEEKALNSGFIDFIGKPILPSRVVERVRKALATGINKRHTRMLNPARTEIRPVSFTSKVA